MTFLQSVEFFPFIEHGYDADVDADDPAHAAKELVVMVPVDPELTPEEVFPATILLDEMGLEV